MNMTRTHYRPDIDGLRAVAVLSVVIFHGFPSVFKAGFIGVDIFFVISGFLISSIIFDNLERGTFSFREFYSRRINRIFPALLIVVFFSWLFGWFALFPDEYMQLGKHIVGGSTFISNFMLLNETGYFDTSSESKVLLHLWSLGIEEQFYLLWPLLLWIAWKIKLNTLLMIILFISISFILNIQNIHSNGVWTFYSPQTRFWELLLGAGLAYITFHKNELLTLWHSSNVHVIRNIQSLIGFTLLVVAFFLPNNNFPGWWAIVPTIGAVLIIASGPSAWVNRIILSNPVAVWLGLISFPLYLWHWPLLAFSRIIESETPSPVTRATTLFLSIFLAWLTYKIIEKPFRGKKPSTLKTLTLLSIMFTIGIVGYISFKYDGFPNRALVKKSNRINSYFVGPLWEYTKNDQCVNTYPLTESSNYGWWFCMKSKKSAPTLMLIGTSFANHLYAGLVKNHHTNKHSILSIGTCDPAKPDITEGKETTNPCSGNRPLHQKELIENIIDQSGTVKYAIIDGLMQDPDIGYIKNLEKYIEHLEQKNVKVIVFIPHLMLNYDIKGCFGRPFKKASRDCSIPYEQKKSIDKAYAWVKHVIGKKHPSVQFFNQNVLLCNNEKKCSGIKDGLPLYRDEYSHYSEYASIQLAKLFVQWASKNSPELLV